MKAFLLAAGLGTRLRPITDTIPKCLVEVHGKPMLYWWNKLFERYNIDVVLINTHHLAEKVRDFIISLDSKIFWEESYEKKLLGSAGTLRINKPFVRGEEDFFIIYADVFTNCDFGKVLKFHRDNKSQFTMVVAEVNDPQNKGIVEIDKNNIITSFIEKPQEPIGKIANMGIFVCTPPILDLILKQEYADMGIDLLPQLLGKMLAYKSDEYFCDIGTLENLKIAENTWQNE